MHPAPLPILLLLALGGCHISSTSNVGDDTTTSNSASNLAEADTPTSITDLLKAGSPKVCNDPDVERTLFDTVKQMPDSGLMALGLFQRQDLDAAVNQLSLSLQAVTFAGADTSIGSVSCNANYVLQITGPDQGQASHSISYEVRPAVDSGEPFVVRSDINRWSDEYSGTVQQLAQSIFRTRVEQSQQQAQGQQPVANAGDLPPPPPPAPDAAPTAANNDQNGSQ